MELIDIYDEYMNLVEIGVGKDKAHAEGLWHRSSHLWIYTSDGYVLFQRRANNKKVYPGLLDISIAGHAITGETLLQCAIREGKEELGIDLEVYIGEIQLVNIYRKKSGKKVIEGIIDNEFNGLFILQIDNKETLNFNFFDGEVSAIQRIHISDLPTEKFETPDFGFVPHKHIYHSIVFEYIKKALCI